VKKLDVVVLDVDGRKLSLGHKQTTANPWDQYEDSFALLELSTTDEIVDKASIEFSVLLIVPKEMNGSLLIQSSTKFKELLLLHTAIFREEEEKM
jgi:small subunit ribosomal protein S1